MTANRDQFISTIPRHHRPRCNSIGKLLLGSHQMHLQAMYLQARCALIVSNPTSRGAQMFVQLGTEVLLHRHHHNNDDDGIFALPDVRWNFGHASTN